MGLSGRKEKQRIGDDPRNTKWAKNESNPGYKLLSSMGWTPSQASLGLASTSSEPVQSSWKRLPTAFLPVLKSTTSGLGAHPAQSSSFVTGAPRFVPSSQSAPSCALGRGDPENVVEIESDKARASKLALVANGLKGGGFDDLLGRLNRQTHKAAHLSVDASQDESFVLVVREPGSEGADQCGVSPMKKKRVRIAEECAVGEGPQKKKHRKDAEAKSEKRRSKREKEEKKKRKSTKVKPTAGPSTVPGSKAETSEDEMVATSSGPLRISRPMNPRMAARAKFIRSKKLASTQNSAAMAEILGIPPSKV